MLWQLALVWAFASPNQTLSLAMPIDVSTLQVGAPATIAELDLATLKGALRQIGWSSDGTQLYLQTADGNPPRETIRHYLVAVDGGAVSRLDIEPEWARAYWADKSDRSAPGVPTFQIDVVQKRETTKIGTGSSRPGTMAMPVGANEENASRASERQTDAVVRFMLFDEAVSEFVDERPIPGLMFSWGARGTGAIVYVDREGHLMFLDQERHKRRIDGVKDATLPAWSMDSARLAYAVKDGRKKDKLVWSTITR